MSDPTPSEAKLSNLGIAAQAWTAPSTEHLTMIPELAVEFAKYLDHKDAKIAELEKRMAFEYYGSCEKTKQLSKLEATLSTVESKLLPMAGNRKLMQVAQPAREILNIIKDNCGSQSEIHRLRKALEDIVRRNKFGVSHNIAKAALTPSSKAILDDSKDKPND